MSLDEHFPRLDPENHRVTSPATAGYNCVAWALNDTTAYWDPFPWCYWPRRIPYNRRFETLVQLFQSHGCEICDNGDVEDGFEKLALYSEDAVSFTHVARQLETGEWASKLGDLEDITHANCECLEQSDYGTVVRWLIRPRST